MARLKTRVGTKLIREKVKALDAEAERGYELSKATAERVQPGRPSLDRGVSPRISYRVPGGLYDRARRKAESQGRTVSEVAREALERYVGG